MTEEEIVEIRERYAAGEATQAELAEEFGTSQPYISRITRGDIWAGADGPIVDGRRRPGRRALSCEDVLAIREAYAAGGTTQAELAEEYDVSKVSISKIVRGMTYADVGGPVAGLSRGRLLAPGQVEYIREVAEARPAVGDLSQRELSRRLAEQYGVHPDTIRGVIRGETYADV